MPCTGNAEASFEIFDECSSFTSPFGLELESLICLASFPIDVYNKRPASSESSDFVFLTYLSISLGGKTPAIMVENGGSAHLAFSDEG